VASDTNTVEVAVEEESWSRHGGGNYQAVVVKVIECCTYSREHKSISFSFTPSHWHVNLTPTDFAMQLRDVQQYLGSNEGEDAISVVRK
jgi:hypothetical protein